MAFYKLEATYKTIPKHAKLGADSTTYTFFHSSFNSMLTNLESNLNAKAIVKVKEISESQYIKNTR